MKVCSQCNVASTWMCCKVLHLVLHLLEKFNIWSKSSWKVLKKVLILHLKLVLHKIPLKKHCKKCWYCCCTIHRWSKSADDNDSDSSDAAAAACVRVGLPELSPSTPSWAFSFHTTSLLEATSPYNISSLLDPPFRLARYVFPPRPYLPVQYVFPPFSPVIICGKTPAVVKPPYWQTMDCLSSENYYPYGQDIRMFDWLRKKYCPVSLIYEVNLGWRCQLDFSLNHHIYYFESKIDNLK